MYQVMPVQREPPILPEAAYLTPIPQIPTVDDILVDVGKTFPYQCFSNARYSTGESQMIV
jgi:hypothetical protein